jgi:NhaP-type Na+/H+ or K+/H+ antiporter
LPRHTLGSGIARQQELNLVLLVCRQLFAGAMPMWKALIDEAREVAWLAFVVGSLSAAGVGLAVVVAAA